MLLAVSGWTVVFIALVGLLIYTTIDEAWRRRNLERALRNFPCPACNAVGAGESTLRVIPEPYRRMHRGCYRCSFVLLSYARCHRCSATFSFDASELFDDESLEAVPRKSMFRRLETEAPRKPILKTGRFKLYCLTTALRAGLIIWTGVRLNLAFPEAVVFAALLVGSNVFEMAYWDEDAADGTTEERGGVASSHDRHCKFPAAKAGYGTVSAIGYDPELGSLRWSRNPGEGDDNEPRLEGIADANRRPERNA